VAGVQARMRKVGISRDSIHRYSLTFFRSHKQSASENSDWRTQTIAPYMLGSNVQHSHDRRFIALRSVKAVRSEVDQRLMEEKHKAMGDVEWSIGARKDSALRHDGSSTRVPQSLYAPWGGDQQ
jgi:hypothetical protein